MSAKTYDVHTATSGPGNPETEPTSYLGDLGALRQTRCSPSQAVYPSDPPPAGPAALTPALHGNGFWNSRPHGLASDAAAARRTSVTFAAPGTYKFYCMIHPFMNGTVIASETRGHVRGPVGCHGGGDFGRRPRCVGRGPRVLGRRRAGDHWNMSPNERDAIHGMPLSPSQTVFPTVVYRRYSAHWHHPCATSPRARATRTSSRGRCCAPGPATACSSTSRTWTRSTSARTRCTSTASTTGPAPTAPTCRASRAATATSSPARRGPTS